MQKSLEPASENALKADSIDQKSDQYQVCKSITKKVARTGKTKSW